MNDVEFMLSEHRASHRDCRHDRLLSVRSELREVAREFDEEGLILEHCRCCNDDILAEYEPADPSTGFAGRNEIHFAAFTFGTESADDSPGKMLPICKRCLQDAEKLVDKMALEYAAKMVGELRARLWPEFRVELEKMGCLRRPEAVGLKVGGYHGKY